MSAYVSRMTRIPLNKIIRISERTIRPENEFKVKEIMTGVEKQVKKWPGLMSVETLVDTEQPHKYVVITEWEDKTAMKSWLKSDTCTQAIKKLDTVLEKDPVADKVAYRELMYHEDNVFLL